MESQFKPGFDGTQGVRARGIDASSPTQLPGYILRVVAIVLTFIAAIVMGVAKETKTIAVTDPSTLSTDILIATAKSTYSSAYVYFIVVNVIVFVYSAFSLGISIANRSGLRNLMVPLSIADLVMVVFLYSSNGAATAIGVLAENGNSHLGWDKICNIASKFCAHVTASIVLSMLASVAYVLLVILGIIHLKRS